MDTVVLIHRMKRGYEMKDTDKKVNKKSNLKIYIIFAVMILCLQQFDGLILGPKLLGDSTGMKPLWIIFAITIGGKFFGVIGMFLGVPVMATLGYLAERYMRHRLKRKHISMDQL